MGNFSTKVGYKRPAVRLQHGAMGRYLRGTQGFSCKYVYADQDANLRDLAEAAHVAYNLACAAARLGNKPEMLTCLRAAALDGDAPSDALSDKDFAAWHGDPELRALADELG
jgi:hypothetical protein